MRTTLDIDKKLLEHAIEETGEKSPSKAVNKVLEDFVYRRALARFEAVAGKLEVADNWRALEEVEMREAAQLRHGDK
jgi:hypothetical protein